MNWVDCLAVAWYTNNERFSRAYTFKRLPWYIAEIAHIRCKRHGVHLSVFSISWASSGALIDVFVRWPPFLDSSYVLLSQLGQTIAAYMMLGFEATYFPGIDLSDLVWSSHNMSETKKHEVDNAADIEVGIVSKILSTSK